MEWNHLDVSKKRKQKQLLLQMKEEIQSLKSQIWHLKFMNFTGYVIKNLKIRIYTFKRVFPIYLYQDREKKDLEYVKETIREYQSVDISLLEKKLKIKKNNYKRLMR